MKKLVAVLTLFISSFVSPCETQAQVDEFAVMGGGAYYLGDLNPYRHFNNYRYLFGGIYRRSLENKQIVLRAHIMYGKVEAYGGEKAISSLGFRSTILEIGPVLEVNYMPYEIGNKKTPGTPYLFMGITYFKMNPQAQNNGNWVSLQTLGTEGQNSSQNEDKNYKSQQISLPIGLGVKVNLGKRFALNLEYGIRKTFTDYLDDVSGTFVDLNILEAENGQLAADLSGGRNVVGLQRGNSKTKDWYSFYGLILSFRIIPENECRGNFGKK